MIRIIKIKNDTESSHIWGGKTFTAGEEHTIQSANISKWLNDTFLTEAITDLEALIGDGTYYFTDINKAIDWLRGNAPVHLASPFTNNEENISFKGKGKGIDLTVGVNPPIDVLVHATEGRLLNGAEAWTDTGLYDAQVTFTIIDKDNVLGYGANVELHMFAEDWQIHATSKEKVFPGYVGAVPAGCYIRMVVDMPASGCFYYNLHLHKKN